MTAMLIIAPGCWRGDAEASSQEMESAAARNPAAIVLATIPPPTLTDTAPHDYDGLRNVVAYADDVYSGSVPEGEAEFETLRAMGIRTIISVDGAAPDVERAKAAGMRYVHLPIGYNGMDAERTLEISRAIRDLPRPVYVHCHHGKHRSAGAAGAAVVTLGMLSNDEAEARMKVSGTSPSYPGLYGCVAVAAPASDAALDRVSDAFPERWQTTGMVQAMLEIDHATRHLKWIEQAGWKTPADHPDLVPAAEAGRLADLLRNLQDDERTKLQPAEFTEWLLKNAAEASALEEGLVERLDAATLSERFKAVAVTCNDCHAKYRNQ